ncbi:hypothetical protein [Hydrogenophaga sp. IBVHS2]|uniref:hypothetical protein n=1 Tax=Hydrogenophaga sp. IBVHS2 TaxID=1985170 RepID=UPI000A2E03BA|nr:hypothetical protein [Hydrogenophaga sp. IBVHS2]OSZ64851.1 hypothetical protein CAP38_10695 [Hydrogenophaga sp. IBVHS2]
MSAVPWPPTSTSAAVVVPAHWTPEQALAVAECLQAMRQALWASYGSQMQQAWREQLMPDTGPPEFIPDEPF